MSVVGDLGVRRCVARLRESDSGENGKRTKCKAAGEGRRYQLCRSEGRNGTLKSR